MEQRVEIPMDSFTDFLKEYVQIPFGGETGATLEESVSLTDGLGAYLGDAAMTVLIGLVVVIATLLVLTGIFYLFGYIMDGAARKAKKAAQKKMAAVVENEAAPAVKAPAVQEGIPGEVVAAIAAAVAMMAPEGKRYALKSVSRKDVGGRSAWAAAGIADNTRPF